MDDGLKILLKSFWGKDGWKNGKVSEEEFEIAKKEGYMFDYPKIKTHQETLRELEDVLKKINYEDIMNAFLYSLSTRKLEYRSALGSYWYAISIPKHNLYSGNLNIKGHCYTCGWYKWDQRLSPTGLNVFNFERYKWGGVRHCHLDYALFDLQQFLKLPKVEYKKEDVKILKDILRTIDKLEPKNKVGKYRDLLIKEKIFKTNKNETSKLLDILGICGILENEKYPCYQEKFVDTYGRDPIEYSNDFEYPVNRWYAKDGINKERLKIVFPIIEKIKEKCYGIYF